MVACGEGKKYHDPSGDNQELSFEASDHRFSYGRTKKWPSIHIPICGFHPQSFEEAGGCCLCLHWILSYASIFPFKKVHIKWFFLPVLWKYRSYDHFSMPTYFPTTLYTYICVKLLGMANIKFTDQRYAKWRPGAILDPSIFARQPAIKFQEQRQKIRNSTKSYFICIHTRILGQLSWYVE